MEPAVPVLGVLTIDQNRDNVFVVTMASDITGVAFINNEEHAGQRVELHFVQGTVGGHALSGFPPSVTLDAPFSLSTTVGARDVLTLRQVSNASDPGGVTYGEIARTYGATITVPDATTSSKGATRLLGGTADAPTVPWTSVTGTPTILPSTRQITAGTGLTGGGDLSADRTLAVAYGTTSGTAAQGNDMRLSNPRDWDMYAGSSPTSGQVPAWNGTAYVPTTITSGGSALPDATSSAKGVVQLGGDLAGTAAAPTVPGLASRVASLTAADSTITVAGTSTAPTVAVNAIAEAKVTGLVADLAARQQFLTPTATKTGAYTAAAGDYVLADLTSAWTLTLPAAPADKTRIGVKVTVQPGTNALTIVCGGSDHLNTATGPTTASLSLLNQAVIWQYNATTAVWIAQSTDVPLSQLDARYDAVGAAAARVATVTAADSTITVAGTATAPTVAVNTIPESKVTNLTTDLAGKASATRQINAGTGLSGGGDLTADRTLAVAYGTTSGTAAAGNDTRITGAAPAASPTFTGTVTAARVVSTPVTVTWAATTTIDASLGNMFRVTLGGNTTLAMPTNLVDGQDVMVEVIQNASTAYTLTLASGWNVTTGITGPVTISTTLGTRSYIGAKYRASGTKMDVLAFGTGVSA